MRARSQPAPPSADSSGLTPAERPADLRRRVMPNEFYRTARLRDICRTSRSSWSLCRKIRLLERGDDRALLHRLRLVGAFSDQVVERLGHCLQRTNLLFDLKSLFDCPRADVAAASPVAPAQRQQLADFGKGKAATLRVLDEVDAPG